MSVRIIHGDCREVLKTLPGESVHCIVTSPPYFGLRDYGVGGQIGLESTPAQFIDTLVRVFREGRRALRADGTLWLNLGDSYAGSGKDGGGSYGPERRGWETNKSKRNTKRYGGGNLPSTGVLKPKDLIGIPWRIAFALQADGWYLRQDIIWSKPNPMPESVTDRCTKAHEYMFLLSKSPRYYFDAEAIAEPVAESTVARLSQPNLPNQVDSARIPGKTNGPMKAVGPRFGGNKYGDDESEQSRTKSGNVYTGKGNRRTFRGGGVYTRGQSFYNDAKPCNDSVGNEPNERGTRNRRSVWTVATMPFKEAHFATFPPELVRPCIRAGSPYGHGVILDPFGGAGTTGLVANQEQRNAILIELNPEYVAMAERRIYSEAPLLTEVSA